MNQLMFAPAVAFVLCTAIASTAVAQSKPAVQSKPTAQSQPAAQNTSAPAAPAKWVPPVKGVATIEVMRLPSKRVGKELITGLKIKNTSTGSINLLKIDELWYNKKREMVTTGTERWRKPFLPGEIIDVTVKSPLVGEPDISQFTFSHANGKIEAKPVKKIQ
jgi:hypothetical protein